MKNYTEQSFWKANIRLDGQEILLFYGTHNFNAVFTTPRHWFEVLCNMP
jgi:hypothetical protein